jgi:hypothetical protein
MKYLVTGLPRSRTLWMSHFLPDCVHEVAHRLNSVDDLNRIPFGISDSGLGFFLKEILEDLKVPTVIIDRDPEEVEESLCKMLPHMPATNYCGLLGDFLAAWQHHPLVLCIRFHDLDARMAEVCAHLGLPYDWERHNRLGHIELGAPTVNYYAECPPVPGALFMCKVIPLIHLKEATYVAGS